jgi:hypothetical protein
VQIPYKSTALTAALHEPYSRAAALRNISERVKVPALKVAYAFSSSIILSNQIDETPSLTDTTWTLK